MAEIPEQSASGFHPHRLTLYATANSDCSTRLRIALNLKELEYNYIASGTPQDAASRPAGYSALNPTNALPTLVVHQSHEGLDIPIPQSLAALEYLDEIKAAPSLYPTKSPVMRAHIRALAMVIAADTHPLTAPKVGRCLRNMFMMDMSKAQQAQAVSTWDDNFIHQGLRAYEKMISSGTFPAGTYSAGERISMADVCLVPQVWRARARELDLSEYPTIQRVMASLEKIEAIRRAHWDNQEKE